MKIAHNHPGFRLSLKWLVTPLCLIPCGLLAAPAEHTLRSAKPDLRESLLRYGPVDVGFDAQASAYYDDNIFISPDKTSDFIWSLAPGIRLGTGDYRQREENYLALRYSPNFILFTDHSDQNSIDHDAAFTGRWRPGVWTLGLSQSYQNLSGAVVDVGNRVDREIYDTDLSAAYELSPKTSIELDGRQRIADYHELISYNEWEALAWVDYRATPLLRVGAGGSAGWVDVENSANQTYQRLSLRADYAVTELVNLRGSVGVERRDYQDDTSEDYEGVFSLGATYSPFETTSFTLDAFRRPQASVRFRNQNYILTGIHAGIQKVFSEIYTASLSGGYEHAEYTPTSQGVNANRSDDYFVIQTGLDWEIRERYVLGAFYSYRQNTSNDPGFDFDNHQVGLAASVKF